MCMHLPSTRLVSQIETVIEQKKKTNKRMMEIQGELLVDVSRPGSTYRLLLFLPIPYLPAVCLVALVGTLRASCRISSLPAQNLTSH